MTLTPIKNLLRADSVADILRTLSDAAVTEVGADAAAIIEMKASGDAAVVECRNVPEALRDVRFEVETIDAELGKQLLARCGGAFEVSHTLPLMSGGDLFGALVLFCREAPPGGYDHDLCAALVDLAAVSLDKVHQHDALRRSYVELRDSRAMLERTEKLRALGEMAAGISHDLKNILNPLSLHLQLLKRTLKRGAGGAEEAIAEMEQVLRRGVETIERLREFSRQAPETRAETVNLNALAHEAAELSRPRVASLRRARGVRIVEAFGAPSRIMARSGELVAALLNLIVNAIDAMEDGGTVTVSTGAAEGTAWVKVADDGPGMPEEVQAHVFEPFFTTKGQAGTGLGLAMVYACVKRHGGELTLDSAVGRGTTFTLRFPAIG